MNIFLSDRLLDEINRQAREEGTDRNSLIQTALENYIEAKRRDSEEEEKRRKMLEASLKMDALAKKLEKWEPQVTIRKFRDTHWKSES